MKRRTCYLAAGALVALGVAAQSTDYAWSAPIFAHKGSGGFTNATCLNSGAWQATLSVTGTNPELHPMATVTFNGQPPMNPVAVPYSHNVTAPPSQSTLTASAHIVWDDGFTQDVGPYVAHRPEGCTPPTTVVGVTTTTTCAAAIPPRDDCNEVTTSTSPTSTPIPVPSSPTSLVPPATTATGNPASTSPEPPRVKSSPSTSQPISLPTTGSSDTVPIVAGIGALLVGGILLLAGRRGES